MVIVNRIAAVIVEPIIVVEEYVLGLVQLLLVVVNALVCALILVLVVVDPVAQVERELTVIPVEPPVLEAVVVQDVYRLVEVTDVLVDVAPHVEDLVVLNVQ